MIKTAEEILSKIIPIQGNLITIDTAKTLMELYANQFKEQPKKSIEERKLNFNDLVLDYINSYPSLILGEFFEYWTEISPNAKKMRFEKEKVFDIKKRLERWKRNQKPNNNGTTDDAIRGFITE